MTDTTNQAQQSAPVEAANDQAKRDVLTDAYRKLTAGAIGTEQFFDIAYAAGQACSAQVASAEQSKITNTLEARAFVDDWHRKHFPTDRTFSRYIKGDTGRNQLAGDFAWQLAKALESLAAPATGAQVAGIDENALNDAAWEFTTHAPKDSIPANLWNNLKLALRPAILCYLTNAAPATAQVAILQAQPSWPEGSMWVDVDAETYKIVSEMPSYNVRTVYRDAAPDGAA